MQNKSFPSLVCFYDQTVLKENGDSKLCCEKGHTYPIIDGIPRVLENPSNYANAFGLQWNIYRLTQLDSYSKVPVSRNRLKRCLGEDLWQLLSKPGKRVEILEVGCGAGRFTEVLLNLPGASVTSIDLSSAVDANLVNCPISDMHRIIQCDLNNLPFLIEEFDIVICLGVIQHTPSPEKTIHDLYKSVKPGGHLVIDHYTHNLSHYTKFSEHFIRPILKRMNPDKAVRVTKFFTKLFFPLHRLVKNNRFLQIILSRFSPLLTYYHSLPELNDQLQYEWSELDTHDYLTDYYKHLRSKYAINKCLLNLNADNIWVEKGGNGVEARCKKSI